jgi:AcrR family transcriptional regulator
MARPQATDYDDKRCLILESAAALFAERGFGGTSMAMIAGAAGGSKAWLYHYYESKDSIVEDLLAGFLTELVAATGGALAAPGSADERFRRLVTEVVRVCAAAPGRAGLFDVAESLPPPVAARVKALRSRFLRDVEAAVVAVAPALEADRGVRAATVQSLLGMLSWQHRWWRDDGPLTLDQWADVVADLVLGGARHVAREARATTR